MSVGFVKSFVLGAAILGAASHPLSADDNDDVGEKTCSNKSLKGTYAFFQTGEVLEQGPVADVGVINADGNGTITGSEVVHLFDGRVVEIVFCNGEYEIAETCIGNFVWDAVVGGPCGVGTNIGERTHTITLGKKEIYILSTTSGTVLAGSGTKR